MPRKKVTVPILFPDGPAATRKSRSRKVITSIRQETGDPWEDGEIWLSRIAMTRLARSERKNGEKDWRRYYEWYEGEQWDNRGGQGRVNSDNIRDTATVNKTGSIINSIVPFLVNGEIKFRVKAKPGHDARSARIQQALLNYEWKERKMTKAMRSCARDFVIIGHCVAKTGYTVEVDESKKPNQDGTLNYADYVKKDAPYIERVNPLNFLFDLTAKDHSLRTARWCAEVFFVPYADVLANQNYDKETLATMRSGDSTPTTQAAWQMMGVDPRSMKAMGTVTMPEDNLVALVEIWDKKYKKRIIMADGCARPLLVEDWPFPYLDGFPYLKADYIEAPNKPYGIGLPRWIEDQQTRLNRIRTNEVNWVQANQPKYNIPENMNPDEITKWENGGAGTGVVGPSPGIQPIQGAQLSIDFDKTEERLNRDIVEATGADDLLQGGRFPSRTTAGEVGTRARLTGLKLDQHVTDFEEFVEDAAVQIDQHLKKHRTTNDVIEIVGEEGVFWKTETIEYTNEDIQAEVDVDVESFSAPKYDPQIERQQRKEIGQLAISAMPVMAERGAPEVFNVPQLFAWMIEPYDETDIGRFFRSAATVGGPPQQSESQGPGAGLPPELAGALAPAQVPQAPGVSAPGEGMSLEDLMQGIRGSMQ